MYEMGAAHPKSKQKGFFYFIGFFFFSFLSFLLILLFFPFSKKNNNNEKKTHGHTIVFRTFHTAFSLLFLLVSTNGFYKC